MPKDGEAQLAQRLASVRQQIAVACAQAAAPGTAPANVTLIAVSKRQPVAAVQALYDLGVRDFGENYAQELVAKAAALAESGRRPRWHFIGALQGNKVARVARAAHVIHTVASLATAQALAAAATPGEGLGPRPTWLLQVRLVDDAERPGVPLGEAPALAQAVAALAPGRLVGLMGVPPAHGDPVPHFARLRALRDALRAAAHGSTRDVCALSMGMSEDFAAAIGEGATMVRVGSALFGPRPPERGL